MKKTSLLLSIIGMVLCCGCGGSKQLKSIPTSEATSTSTNVPATETPIPTLTPTPMPDVVYQLSGIDLGPYITGDPNLGATVSETEIRNLIERIAPYTYWVRTYGTENGLEYAGAIAHEYGLSIAVTAWLSSDLEANERQMASLIDMAKNGEVDLAIIGNETLLREDLTESELLNYITRFKEEVPNVPVTTTDVWSKIKKSPDLIATMDVVAVNVYPYWENIGIDEAFSAVKEWYKDAVETVEAISPGKNVIVAETGWPSCGENGDPTSALYYLSSFTSFARVKSIQYFWFEAYDEAWKAEYEGEAGACWGLWDSEGQLKPGIDEIFAGNAGSGKVVPEREPKLDLTLVPPMGSITDLAGIAWFVNPEDYRVAVYIYVPDAGGWWIKPTFDFPLTEINKDGSWSCPVFTGGIDEQATKVAAFLVPNDYNPPAAAGWSSLPQELYDISVSEVETNR